MKNGFPSILLLLTSAFGTVYAADEPSTTTAPTGDPEMEQNALADTQAVPAVKTLFIQQKLILQSGYGPENSALGADRKHFYSVRYEPSLTWYSPDRQFPTWQGFARAWINYASSTTTSPFQEPNEQRFNSRSQETYEQPKYFSSELREFYLKRNLLAEDPRYSMTIGRQKFADHYGLWWDDGIEALRLDYADTFATGFFSVARKFYTYNSDNNSLRESDRDITYGMGEYALRWDDRNWVGLRFLLEQDNSGEDVEDAQDFDGGRLGLFAYGEDLRISPLFSDYRVELAALKGKLDTVDSQDDSVHGWMMIGEIGKRFTEEPWTPRVSLRAGFTDKPSKPSEGFYLNNIQSDRVTNKETYTNGLFSSFISVDLHNLAFYSFAIETQPAPRHSADLRLSDLYLRDENGGVPMDISRDSANQPRAVEGKSLGQILDLNYYWQMFPIGFYGQQLNLNLLASAGYFWSGDAAKDLGNDFQVSLGIVMRY